MSVRLAERMRPNGSVMSTGEPGESYCPECGQSLDLTRHVGMMTRQDTLDSYVFTIFGLILFVVFAVNAWQAHRVLVGIDQQIANSRASTAQDDYSSASDRERTIARIVNSFRIERFASQQKFDRDMAGFALGVVTTTFGVGTLIRQRRERSGPIGRSCQGLLVNVTLKLWNLGNSVIRPLLWVVVLLFGGLTVGHVIRGEPLTLDLLDRALQRSVEIIATISGTQT